MSNKKKPAQVKKALEDFLEENAVGDRRESNEAEERIAELEAEVQDLKEKLARQMADMANMRRRQAEDMQRTRENSIMQFASEMLPILDSFRMSLASEGSKEDLHHGIEMIMGMMTDLLSRHGVEEVPAQGQEFDPRFHEAIAAIDEPDSAPGTVLKVQMPGYRIGERILRPSRVIVSKTREEAGEDTQEAKDS